AGVDADRADHFQVRLHNDPNAPANQIPRCAVDHASHHLFALPSFTAKQSSFARGNAGALCEGDVMGAHYDRDYGDSSRDECTMDEIPHGFPPYSVWLRCTFS